MSNTIDRINTAYLKARGVRVGSTLENKCAVWLHRRGVLDQCQHRVGKYRIDFAWPRELIALEADGPHHWQPDIAVRDVARACDLRARGWLVFRVDEMSGNLEDQLGRVAGIVEAARAPIMVDPEPFVITPAALRLRDEVLRLRLGEL